jgi:TetR/AcrR family fatty acid metabolism transcriptional regulator
VGGQAGVAAIVRIGDPVEHATEPRQQTKRGARTRERILESAIDVFARRGLHATRVADIAEQAGIAYGLVYHHFRNKEEILGAIFQERWGFYVAYLKEMTDADLPFAEKLTRLVHFWVEGYRHVPALMTVMINEIGRSYEFIESHDDLGAVMMTFAPIEVIIDQGKRAGQVRDDVDAKLLSWAVIGVAEMVLSGYVTRQLVRDDREAYLQDERQIIALLLNGMAAAS